mgnify:CR=1 FL=1
MSSDEYNENEEYETQDESYEPDYEEEEEKPRKGSRIVLIIAVLVLVGLNIFLGINIYNQSQVLKGKKAEIAALDSQKQLLIQRVDSLRISLEEAKGTVDMKDAELNNLIAELDKYKEDLNGAESKIKSLQSLATKARQYDKYKAQAEQSIAEIEKLKEDLKTQTARADNAEIAQDTLTQKLNELNQEKEKLQNKVKKGSILGGGIKKITSLKMKPGSSKRKETTKASQVNTVEVSYTIGENPIAERGTKTVYIVIKKGDQVLGDASKIFEADGGKQMQYTLKEDVKYEGKESKRSPSLSLTEELEPGTYNVEVYMDNKLFSKDSFSLR